MWGVEFNSYRPWIGPGLGPGTTVHMCILNCKGIPISFLYLVPTRVRYSLLFLFFISNSLFRPSCHLISRFHWEARFFVASFPFNLFFPCQLQWLSYLDFDDFLFLFYSKQSNTHTHKPQPERMDSPSFSLVFP